MRTEFVKMIHPNLPGQVYKAPKQGIGVLKRSGWVLAPDDPPAPPEAPPAPAPTTEAPAATGASSSPDNDQPPQRRRAEKKGE